MRTQGVDIPDPSGANGSAPGQAPTGIDQAALQRGIQACGQYLQGGGAPPGGPGAAGFPGGGQAFAQCLRKEGIAVPDPQADQAPASGMPSLDPQDPKVQAAVAKCRSGSQ